MYSKWEWNKSRTRLPQLNTLGFKTNNVQISATAVGSQFNKWLLEDCGELFIYWQECQWGGQQESCRTSAGSISTPHPTPPWPINQFLTLKQSVWCKRSIKITMPWILVGEGTSKSQRQTGGVEPYTEISPEICNILGSESHVMLPIQTS